LYIIILEIGFSVGNDYGLAALYRVTAVQADL